MAGEANSARAVLYALGANFAIALTKYAAAVITGSGSMLGQTLRSWCTSAGSTTRVLPVSTANCGWAAHSNQSGAVPVAHSSYSSWSRAS